jgi:hypothetical protein
VPPMVAPRGANPLLPRQGGRPEAAGQELALRARSQAAGSQAARGGLRSACWALDRSATHVQTYTHIVWYLVARYAQPHEK